jgi:outer membrane receptor protein involved in Fe transport
MEPDEGDSVDLNFIPSNLIERTEIVTGGASAAYGSGAIAGVVNILLNHDLQGLKVDADYGASEHGDGDQIGAGYRTNWRYTFAVDAVLDPTTSKPVCRVSLFGLNPGQLAAGADPSLAVGCEPLNVFGTGGASPEALAYAFGNLTEHDNITQNVVAGTVSGRLWDGWGAGPLSSAAGVEYRVDKLDNDAGDLPFAQRTDFALQSGDTFAGKTKITEGFLELEMPLLRDAPRREVRHDQRRHPQGELQESRRADRPGGHAEHHVLEARSGVGIRSTGCVSAAVTRAICARPRSASCITHRAFQRAACSVP